MADELLSAKREKYPINKGIGRPVEFKGLKAQYLFLFAGGLLAAFILFVILYMAGASQWLCTCTWQARANGSASASARCPPPRSRGSRSG